MNSELDPVQRINNNVSFPKEEYLNKNLYE